MNKESSFYHSHVKYFLENNKSLVFVQFSKFWYQNTCMNIDCYKKYKKIFVKDHCDFISYLIFKILVSKCWQDQMLYFGIALYKTSPLKKGLKSPKLQNFHVFLTIYVILCPFWTLKYFQKIFLYFFSNLGALPNILILSF